MKYMILSDIHGSETCLQKALAFFHPMQCDFLVLLGDLLYHGPRNPLPQGYNPAGVAALLNTLSDKIIAVRGNCDAEVDQKLFDFPCMSEYAWIVDEGTRIFATHGHRYHPGHLPPLGSKDVFLYGHTHLWEIQQAGHLLIGNPGSVASPKQNRPHTFAIYQQRCIRIFALDGSPLHSVGQ